MAVYKTSNKIHNKKLRRRREGLSAKSYEYGELDGVELALFIRYTKRGDFYSYMSQQHLPWLQDLKSMMTHARAKTEFPKDVKKRVEASRKKLKKPSDAIIPEDASEQDEEGSPEAVHIEAFPDFPFDIAASLKELLGSN